MARIGRILENLTRSLLNKGRRLVKSYSTLISSPLRHTVNLFFLVSVFISSCAGATAAGPSASCLSGGTCSMEIISGTSALTIPDNGAGDSQNTTSGLIQNSSTSSVDGWSFVLATGEFYGASGDLGLNVTATTSSTAPTLHILLSETGLTSGVLNGHLGIGGTTPANASVHLKVWQAASNALFDLSSAALLDLTTTTVSGGGFSFSGNPVFAALASPYSETIEITFDAPSGNYSAGANLTRNASAPEPATLALLGLGLAGLGFRRKQA
jgi:hypothetical protein